MTIWTSVIQTNFLDAHLVVALARFRIKYGQGILIPTDPEMIGHYAIASRG